jgi:hypothetical protein
MFSRPIAVIVAAFSLIGCAANERAPGVEGDYEYRALGPGGTAGRSGECVGNTTVIKSLSEADGYKGICASNLCDPNCKSFDERPVVAYATPGYTSTWWENDGGFGGSPPGFVNKLVKEPCSEPRDCGYDMHCNATTRKCEKNEPGWTYSALQCSGVNMTVGAACNVGGRTQLPVCNRGTKAIPSGRTFKLAIKNGDWIDQRSCPVVPAASQNCSHTLAQPLFPGACVTVDTCGWTGNSVAFVNADLGIAECSGADGSFGCSDNWSDVKVVPCAEKSLVSYLPVVYEQRYTASCPVSSRVQWELLTYDATIASNLTGASGAMFEVQTAPQGTNGTVGAFSPYVTAADTRLGDPAVCKAGGPLPCPKRLPLTDAESHNGVLNMRITLSPTPDYLMKTTLRSWQVSYSCVPTE